MHIGIRERRAAASVTAVVFGFLVCTAHVAAQSATSAADRPALQSRSSSTTPPAATQPAAKKIDPRVLYWSRALFLSLILFVIFTFAALAIIVFSRRYRATLARGQRPPTPSDDVWAMHKPPPPDEPDPPA